VSVEKLQIPVRLLFNLRVFATFVFESEYRTGSTSCSAWRTAAIAYASCATVHSFIHSFILFFKKSWQTQLL